MTLMFLEMALIDTRLDILGVAYELVVVDTSSGTPTAIIEKLMQQSSNTPVDIDWDFVSKFVNDWYTSHSYNVHPPTNVDLTSFFNFNVGFMVELEKLICTLSFGAAMDVVNSNFQSVGLPLPLI